MGSMDTRRAVLYGRVSQARRETKSVTDQLNELRAWADREDWVVVAEHSDEVSASRYANGKGRPGWQSVTEILASGGADILAVWEISRASRDRVVFAALIAQCVESRVTIGSGGRLQDPADAEQGFMLDLEGALAVRESSKTAERCQRAVNSRATLGRPHAALPYGYRRVCSSETGVTLRWELHPDQAPIVAEIVTRLLARESADSIAADLNRRGIPTGGAGRCLMRCGCRNTDGRVAGSPDPTWQGDHERVSGRWQGGNLSKLVVKPSYAGLRAAPLRGAPKRLWRSPHVLDGVKTTWPSIIEETDHYALVAIYGSAERDKWRTPKHQKHLGTGLYRCGREGCDGRMRVVVDRGKPNRYDCRVCHRISRRQKPVDELIEALLIARLSQPDVLDTLSRGDDTEVTAARVEVARLRAKLAHARLLVDQDRLSLESLADLEARTLPRIEAAQRTAQPRDVPTVVTEVAGEHAAQRWAQTTVADRRAILDVFIEVTILPTSRRFQPFDPDTVRIDWKT